MSAQFDPSDLDRMRNNPNNYKWGIFYFNSQDPRTIVSKRNPEMGFTLNFASPYSYLLILGIMFFATIMGRLGK